MTNQELQVLELKIKTIPIKLEKLNWKPCDCHNSEYDKFIQTQKYLKWFKEQFPKIGIPEGEYQNFCFDMLKIKIPVWVADLVDKKSFVDHKGKEKNSFLFWSKKPGTGKTLLALSILNSMVVEHKLTA